MSCYGTAHVALKVRATRRLCILSGMFVSLLVSVWPVRASETLGYKRLVSEDRMVTDQQFSFSFLEDEFKSGRGAQIDGMVNGWFPHGSSVQEASAILTKAGAKCGERQNPDGGLYIACRKLLPVGTFSLSAIEWDVIFYLNPGGFVDHTLALRNINSI